jgi:hypothetical protein
MEGVDYRLLDDRSPGVEEQELTASVLTYTTGSSSPCFRRSLRSLYRKQIYYGGREYQLV